jgi:hypothetical protein
VYALGGQGEAAISLDVVRDLTDMGYKAQRIAGVDRYRTALAVAQEIGSYPRVLIATGTDFPDALTAGNAASAAQDVVVLTRGRSLTGAALRFLEEEDEPIFATGGPAEAAAAEANVTATPIVGEDRYATAVQVARAFFRFDSVGQKRLGLASGQNFPDAKTADAAFGSDGDHVVLARRDTLRSVTAAYSRSVGASPATVFGFVIGGPTAISREIYDAFDAEPSRVVGRGAVRRC